MPKCATRSEKTNISIAKKKIKKIANEIKEIQQELRGNLPDREEEDDMYLYHEDLHLDERDDYRSAIDASKASEWQREQVERIFGGRSKRGESLGADGSSQPPQQVRRTQSGREPRYKPPIAPSLYKSLGAKQNNIKDMFKGGSIREKLGRLVSKFFIYDNVPPHKADSHHFKNMIIVAQQSGQRVIGEPVVSGLILDDSGLWAADFVTAAKYVMSPPIRASGHNKALQAALSSGVLQLVGTDHCPFTSTQKSLGIDDFRKIPNGVNGIEERMHLVWHTMVESGKISPTDYVRLTSTECARIFNIYPRKGAILAGSDADIIILNPNSSFEITARSHHSRLDTNVFEGMKGKGKVEVTIAGGRIVWENDQLKVVPGSGKYIEMPPFSYLFDGIEKAEAKYLSSLHAPVKRFNSAT